MLRRDAQILLCHRHPDRSSYPNVWDFPGGHVERNESPAEALARELREELGIVIDPPTQRPWKRFTLDGGELDIFLVAAWEAEPENLATDEHDELAWVTPSAALGLPLADNSYHQILEELASN